MSTSPTSNNTTFFDDWSGQDLKSTSNVTITPTTHPWSIATLPFANSEAVDVSPTHDVSPQACQPPTSISPPNLYPKRPCSSNAEIEAPMLKQPVTRKRGCPRLNRTVIVSSGDSGKSAVKSHKTRIPHTEVERKYRRFPLTQENLRLLENQTSSAMSASRTSSRSRSNLDNRNKLGAYRILIDKGYTCPPDLERHIQNVVHRPWPSPSSQNAKKVVEKRRVAAQQNERGGIKQIEPYLLFRGEAEADDRVSGVPFIYSKDEINLARSFLPSAPNANITQTWGDLSQPRPDTAIGYITRGDAENTMPPSQTAFSPEEDEVLDGYRLSPYFHFPFLTSQWETPNSNQNHSHAHNQAGRDGAVIVNHLHEFYSVAYGCEREPTVVETCHFSLTCDLLNGNIFAHWRDQDVHHMELLYEFSLRKEAEVQQARQMLWNILDYAVGERLQSIKAALPAFARNRGQFRPILESTVAGSEASSLGSHSCVQFQTP